MITRGRLRRASSPGFTLVELMVVVTIIGVIVRIALPQYSAIRKKATAAAVVSDVRTIGLAAFSYYADAGVFPPAAANGKVPAQLATYLPAKFTFKSPDFTYRWYSWKVNTGKGKNKKTETMLGVRVTSKDPALVAALSRVGGPGFASIVTATTVTFLVTAS